MKEYSQVFLIFDKNARQLICQGEWSLAHLNQINNAFKKMNLPSSGEMIINGRGITKIDSAGAWFLSDYIKKTENKNIKIDLQGFSKAYETLITIVKKQPISIESLPAKKTLSWVARLGQYIYQQYDELHQFLIFVGQLTTELLRVITRPRHIRWRETVGIIDKAGCQALPIVAILSFMIGVVLAYQMGLQLRQYGANIYIVDLLGLSILREFGPLITAIMIAGRTGSAFTAQLGIMKINQEIDSLNTMGITPSELLLLPRLVGLFIALPLLTMWSNLFGILGGMMMSNSMLGITSQDFLVRFQHAIPLRALMIGIGKAPIFALIIGSIGCFEGMQVRNTAESIGTQTTRSVVLAIFFIVVADAVFSVIFSKFNL